MDKKIECFVLGTAVGSWVDDELISREEAYLLLTEEEQFKCATIIDSLEEEYDSYEIIRLIVGRLKQALSEIELEENNESKV